ncbi:MAG: heme exporter protein CcmB [Rickettsiales bacterium]
MRYFLSIFRQSVMLSFRKGGGAMGACAFYIITIALFIFAMGPQMVSSYTTSVMSISMLLAIITTLPLMFERDYEDGSLEQIILQPVLLEIMVLAKICGSWCSNILPILIVSPLIAISASLSVQQILVSLSVLTVASFVMVALGAIGAALTIGSKRGGLLQALVIMPLYIPILIFSSTNSGEHGLLFLSGILLFLLPLSCYVCAALIRISSD